MACVTCGLLRMAHLMTDTRCTCKLCQALYEPGPDTVVSQGELWWGKVWITGGCQVVSCEGPTHNAAKTTLYPCICGARHPSANFVCDCDTGRAVYHG